jgi:dihydrofolate synthase/folylpolyglutamate synthase
MDHEAYLGDTLAAIAAEKAGILKPGVPAVIGRQEPEALAAILRRAAEIEAPLLVHGRDWQARETKGRLVVETPARTLELPRPALPGVHQIENGGLAVMAALSLPEAGLSDAELTIGLRTARWPARLQRLTRGPAVDALPQGSELWLDGGHNPAAGQALASTLSADSDPRPLHLVVGMLDTKDLRAFLEPLAAVARSLAAVPITSEPHARAPEEIATSASALGLPSSVHASVEAAVTALAAREPAPCRVLVCGSLYLAGEVLGRHG